MSRAVRDNLTEFALHLAALVAVGIFTFTVGDWWALPAGVLQ